jgi:hypothetical protein
LNTGFLPAPAAATHLFHNESNLNFSPSRCCNSVSATPQGNFSSTAGVHVTVLSKLKLGDPRHFDVDLWAMQDIGAYSIAY